MIPLQDHEDDEKLLINKLEPDNHHVQEHTMPIRQCVRTQPLAIPTC